jgi:hypothetical protein
MADEDPSEVEVPVWLCPGPPTQIDDPPPRLLFVSTLPDVVVVREEFVPSIFE